MKIFNFPLVIFLFFSLSLKATDITSQTLRGTVVDAVTAYPLIGANVILLNTETPVGTTTDLNGNFELKNVPLGRQSLEIRYIGYKNQLINNIMVASAKEIVLKIQLEEIPLALEEVVVKSKRKKEQALNEMAQISARTFSVEETERFAGSLGDPARMVANYAGVMTQNDSRNDIIIRGNSPMGVLWRLEGIEIPNPNHFGALGTTGGPVSMVNNNLLTNSDFLTGAFPAEFGNAIAGAFDLNLRSGNNQVHEFTGQVGFNGFELGAEGPVAKTSNGVNPSYLANFRYSTLEVFDLMGFSTGTGAAIPEYQDFTFMIDVPGTKLGRLKVFGLWGKSHIELGRDLSDTTGNSYNSKNTATDFGSDLAVIGAKHTYFFTDKTRLQTSISYQMTGATAFLDSVNRETQVFKPWFRSRQSENKLTVSSQFRHKFSSRDNFSLGFIADFYQIDYLDSIYDEDYRKFITIANTEGTSELYRAYGQWLHNFNNQFSAYAGMHFQYLAMNKELVAEPRLSLKWQALTKHAFTAGFGLHSQMQPRVLYSFQSYDEVSDTYSITNKDVKFTRSMHYVLGYNYQISSDMRLKTEAYYQYLYRAPVVEDFPEFSMLNFGGDFGIPRQDNLINEGTGTNYGLELTLEKFLNKGFYTLFTASLFESKYKGFDQVERNTAFNGNYVFNMLGGWEHKLGAKTTLTIDVKTVWAGGKRYVPIDLEESQRKGEEVLDWSRAYESKYDDYFRTDLRLGVRLNGKKTWQEWALDLQNVTGFQSVFMQGYDVEKNEIYTVYQQGFMPMMLYRIHF